MVLMAVKPVVLGNVRRICWTWVPCRMTGQRCGSFLRPWVLESIFFPFFWFTKVTVMCSVLVSRSAKLCSMTASVVVRNMKPSKSMHFVCPDVAGFEHSQERRIAKKNAPITRSAATAEAVSRRNE